MLINSSYRGAPSISATEPTVEASWRSEQCVISSSFFGNSLILYRKPQVSACWCYCSNLCLIDMKAVSSNMLKNSISNFFSGVVIGLSWAS
jgi:hypothetical protein